MKNKEKFSQNTKLDILEPACKRVLKFAKNCYIEQQNLSSAETFIMINFFNFLVDAKENQDKYNIKIRFFLSNDGGFADSFPTSIFANRYFNMMVCIQFEEFDYIKIRFIKQIDQNGTITYHFTSESKDRLYLNPEYLFEKIRYCAITEADIKGKMLHMPENLYYWENMKMDETSFEDIFLPNNLKQDLQLYVSLFEKNGKMLRYLLSGSPGTGKTETAKAIMNFLNKKGLTVIKTVPDHFLQDKIKFAELLAPSVIVLDDVDMYLGNRSKGSYAKILGKFLDVLDGTKKIQSNVGILATTNSLELLDLAAQRPGRFDKTLSFDSLTRDNIKNIIFKSMNKNFEKNENDNLFKRILTTPKVIEIYYNDGSTGAYIYENTKMLRLRFETLGMKNITEDSVIEEIKNGIETLDKIRETSFLKSKMSKRSKLGFSGGGEEELYGEEPEPIEETGEQFLKRMEQKGEEEERNRKANPERLMGLRSENTNPNVHDAKNN